MFDLLQFHALLPGLLLLVLGVFDPAFNLLHLSPDALILGDYLVIDGRVFLAVEKLLDCSERGRRSGLWVLRVP